MSDLENTGYFTHMQSNSSVSQNTKGQKDSFPRLVGIKAKSELNPDDSPQLATKMTILMSCDNVMQTAYSMI